MTAAPVVSLFLADSRVGSGHRCYVVLASGRKWVSLFYPPALASVKVERRAFERAARPVEVKVSKMIARIRRDRSLAKDCGMFDGGEAAKQALRILRGVDQ